MQPSPLLIEAPPRISAARLAFACLTLATVALVATGFGLSYEAEVSASAAAGTSAAVPLDAGSATVYAGGLVGSVRASGATWGDALSSLVYEADAAWPSLADAPSPGTALWLDRSTPFSIVMSDRRLSARGFGRTVGEGLASAGIYLFGRDQVVPALDAPLLPNLAVRVDRVAEAVEITQETTSFETIWEGDPQLEIDQTRMVREGQVGVLLRRYKLTYVNGARQDEHLEDWWIQQEPLDRLMAYGTMVVPRDVQTTQGVRQYWRQMRVLITSYSPSTAGQARTSPHYGITRTGKRAGYGIIAVDPSVIPFGTSIYVPGYGIGVAEDTGGSIIGRHLDVCYDDNNLESWYRWVDVYLLTPAPPASTIRYVLPNWPKER